MPSGPSKASERLLERLRAMGVGVPPGSRVRRTNAGRHQRAAGAWSWFVVGPDGREVGLGSQYPIKDLLRERLVVTRHFGSPDHHVDPVEPGGETEADLRGVWVEPINNLLTAETDSA